MLAEVTAILLVLQPFRNSLLFYILSGPIEGRTKDSDRTNGNNRPVNGGNINNGNNSSNNTRLLNGGLEAETEFICDGGTGPKENVQNSLETKIDETKLRFLSIAQTVPAVSQNEEPILFVEIGDFESKNLERNDSELRGEIIIGSMGHSQGANLTRMSNIKCAENGSNETLKLLSRVGSEDQVERCTRSRREKAKSFKENSASMDYARGKVDLSRNRKRSFSVKKIDKNFKFTQHFASKGLQNQENKGHLSTSDERILFKNSFKFRNGCERQNNFKESGRPNVSLTKSKSFENPGNGFENFGRKKFLKHKSCYANERHSNIEHSRADEDVSGADNTFKNTFGLHDVTVYKDLDAKATYLLYDELKTCVTLEVDIVNGNDGRNRVPLGQGGGGHGAAEAEDQPAQVVDRGLLRRPLRPCSCGRRGWPGRRPGCCRIVVFEEAEQEGWSGGSCS